MPYVITDKADGCSGGATIRDDGDSMGCHLVVVRVVELLESNAMVT